VLSQGLDDCHLRWDSTAVARDREHHFRDAVAAGLAGEEVDQRAVQHAGDDWREQHEPPPETGQLRVGDVAEARVVGVPGQRQRERLDQPSEGDRATARSGAHQQGHDQQTRVRGAKARDKRGPTSLDGQGGQHPAPAPRIEAQTARRCHS